MKLPITPRAANFAIAAGCAAAMGFAFYLQYSLYLEPCPLCMTQRIFVCLVGILAVVAVIHNPGRGGIRGYSVAGMVASLVGGGFSVRHVWLQQLPEDLVPACGPSLQYMLETLPLNDTLNAMLSGDGNCAEVVWSFLGLSIPAWTLVVFAGLLVCNLLLFLDRD
jgi:disulfide bond formation protein DsbB